MKGTGNIPTSLPEVREEFGQEHLGWISGSLLNIVDSYSGFIIAKNKNLSNKDPD